MMIFGQYGNGAKMYEQNDEEIKSFPLSFLSFWHHLLCYIQLWDHLLAVRSSWNLNWASCFDQVSYVFDALYLRLEWMILLDWVFIQWQSPFPQVSARAVISFKDPVWTLRSPKHQAFQMIWKTFPGPWASQRRRAAGKAKGASSQGSSQLGCWGGKNLTKIHVDLFCQSSFLLTIGLRRR